MKILKKVTNKSKEKYLKKFPMVEVKWKDITSESGWQNLTDVKNGACAICITKGHLIDRKNGITKIFGDYALTEQGDSIAEVGNTTLIPNGCIIETKKL